jgi:hypothetical protein
MIAAPSQGCFGFSTTPPSRPSPRDVANQELLDRIREIYKASRENYGALSSIGHRNTRVEFISWRTKSQCLSGSLVQAYRDGIEIGLRVNGEIGTLREILTQ